MKNIEMEFDSEKFERRLLNLKDTQDSITALSKWCLNKRTAHKQIVKSWLKTLKEGSWKNSVLPFWMFHFLVLIRNVFFAFSKNRASINFVLPRE
jgi:hypothetical protein